MAEQLGDRILKEDERHLKAVRKNRLIAWNDETLDPLARAVLGLTGSEEMLEKYRKLIDYVDECQGQPVIYVDRVNPDSRLVDNAKAGIISGSVTMAKFYNQDRRSGHLQLNVPVDTRVSWMRTFRDGVKVFTGEQVTGDPQIRAAVLINNTWENNSLDPSGDYFDEPIRTVLIGREAIYDSELFGQGVRDVLLSVEHAAGQV